MGIYCLSLEGNVFIDGIFGGGRIRHTPEMLEEASLVPVAHGIHRRRKRVEVVPFLVGELEKRGDPVIPGA